MARKEKKYHFIYKTTNLLSGKYYIGMHSTDNLNDGYMGSGKRLRYSINKYGKQNHKVEILEFFDSRDELKKREREIVNLNEIAKEECMNLVVGGEGGGMYNTIEKMKEVSKKGNEKLKYLRQNNEEWSKKDSEVRSQRRKMEFETGVRDKNKFKFDWTGIKRSEETKQKIGKANSEKQKGELNSQFGTCRITKEGVNKKIKKNDIEIFMKKGWNKGAVFKK